MSGVQGAGVRSIRPFQSSEQYLFAMKEDMAEWLKDLYELDISVDTFLEVLETGAVLCQHANNITRVAAEFSAEYPALAGKVHLPRARLRVNRVAQPGTFQARDNVSNFIQWCRKEMDITDVLMFETDDLVLRKNEKNFVLCLLELARRASRFGMSAPVLIQMEEQIEEEIREEMELPPVEIPIPKPQRRPCDFKNLDQMVQHLVSRCTCPMQFSMIKVSEGKYRVGDSNTLIFVRILRNHVMVRVGGGWDTLEHYLDKHDPCRCTSLSHKQALKVGGSQKQTAPVHEIRSGLTAKLQTTLIVSRSQSPLPAVDWRTYTPGLPSVRSQLSSSSMDEIDRTLASRNTLEQWDPKRGVTLRSQERPATPSQRKSFPEDRIKAKQITSPSTGRDHISSSTSSLASQLTESEDDYSRASEVISPTQCGRQAARTKVSGKNESSVKGNRHAQTPLQPNTSKNSTPPTFKGAQQQPIVQEQSTRAFAGRPRSLSPSKHLQPATRQAKGKDQNLNSQSASAAIVSRVPMSLPSTSPTKSTTNSSKKDPNLKNQLQENSMSTRPPTPRIGAKGEFQFRNGGSILFGDTTKSPAHQMLRTSSVGSSIQGHIEDRSLNTITKKVRRPHLETGGGTGRCDTVWEDESMERNNTNNKDLQDDVERERAYTPLPINQEEEQQLYRSLEDEILSNIKELKEDSDENNHTEDRLGDFTPDCSISSDTAVQDFSTTLTSVSSFPSTLKIGGEGIAVPRSGVYINTKWQPNVNYDNVISELSKGQKKLNRVDVENWIAKIPQKGEGDFPTEPSLPISNGTKGETEHLQMEQPNTRRKNASVETKGLKIRRVPSQRTRGVSKEFRRNTQSSQATCDGQESSTTIVTQANDLDKYKPLQGTKPRRSLKKPERVPSIYKLKLRPKIRPRRDNRPEKQPSKIPTPVKYRQETTAGSAKDTTKALPCQASRRQSQESQRSSLVRNTAQSTEKPGSDNEAWMSDHSNSPQSKTSGSRSDQGQSQPERTEEDEESWV
ncbi:GAS2-like protein 2 [Lissotriton helveticus]